MVQRKIIISLKVLWKVSKLYKKVNKIIGGDDEGADGEEKPADFEARGGPGVNKNVYWVTDYILGKWTKLPDLLPSDIKATRDIKVTFTGNLDK